jgi:hypothetical protein
MCGLNKHIIKNENVAVENVDIFKYLNSTNNKFNVFDFDLMEALDENRVKQIIDVVDKTALSRAIICIISVGGRSISSKEYKDIMPKVLINEIGNKGIWRIINKPFSGKYKDIIMPMRVEIVVIEKQSWARNWEKFL